MKLYIKLTPWNPITQVFTRHNFLRPSKAKSELWGQLMEELLKAMQMFHFPMPFRFYYWINPERHKAESFEWPYIGPLKKLCPLSLLGLIPWSSLRNPGINSRGNTFLLLLEVQNPITSRKNVTFFLRPKCHEIVTSSEKPFCFLLTVTAYHIP